MDLYNGFNGLRHRINWTYFTVLDGLAHPLYSINIKEQYMEIKKIFETVCKAITSAMGVAVVVLSIVTDLEENTAISLLGIGLTCAGLALMSK